MQRTVFSRRSKTAARYLLLRQLSFPNYSQNLRNFWFQETSNIEKSKQDLLNEVRDLISPGDETSLSLSPVARYSLASVEVSCWIKMRENLVVGMKIFGL